MNTNNAIEYVIGQKVWFINNESGNVKCGNIIDMKIKENNNISFVLYVVAVIDEVFDTMRIFTTTRVFNTFEDLKNFMLERAIMERDVEIERANSRYDATIKYIMSLSM